MDKSIKYLAKETCFDSKRLYAVIVCLVLSILHPREALARQMGMLTNFKHSNFESSWSSICRIHSNCSSISLLTYMIVEFAPKGININT